jgi:hypothetical protein
MLIQHVDFLGINVYETYKLLLSSTTLLLVSKLAIALDVGGTVPGFDPWSYCAKGYAMVSGLVLLKRIENSCLPAYMHVQ